MGFSEYVRKLESYIDKNKVPILHYTDIAIILGVSPSYAISIARSLARKRGWVYERGLLVTEYYKEKSQRKKDGRK